MNYKFRLRLISAIAIIFPVSAFIFAPAGVFGQESDLISVSASGVSANSINLSVNVSGLNPGRYPILNSEKAGIATIVYSQNYRFFNQPWAGYTRSESKSFRCIIASCDVDANSLSFPPNPFYGEGGVYRYTFNYDVYKLSASSAEVLIPTDATYDILRNGQEIAKKLPASQTSFSDTGLAPGTSYSYTVRIPSIYSREGVTNIPTAYVNYSVGYHINPVKTSIPLANSKTKSISVSTSAVAPGVPHGLTTTGGSGEVDIFWNPPISNGGSAINEYKIYRTDRSGSDIFIGNATGTIYADKNIQSGNTSVIYKVSAVNAVGEGQKSSGVSVNIPGAVQRLSTTVSNGKVNMFWNAPASNGGASISNYQIYRGLSAGSEVLLRSISGADVSFSDSGLVNGTEYYYKISAVNAIGEGPVVSISAEPSPDFSVIADTPQDSGPAQGITINSPAFSEQWPEGTDQEIKWSITGSENPSHVSIKFIQIDSSANTIMDTFISLLPIALRGAIKPVENVKIISGPVEVPNTGSYKISIPRGLPARAVGFNEYYVEIECGKIRNPQYAHEANYKQCGLSKRSQSINVTATPIPVSFRINSPSYQPARTNIFGSFPEEVILWPQGSTQKIIWFTDNLISSDVNKKVDFHILRKNSVGTILETVPLALNLSNTITSIEVRVPEGLRSSDANNIYYLRISCRSGYGASCNSSEVRIDIKSLPLNLKITSPAEGARWQKGSYQYISWQSENLLPADANKKVNIKLVRKQILSEKLYTNYRTIEAESYFVDGQGRVIRILTDKDGYRVNSIITQIPVESGGGYLVEPKFVENIPLAANIDNVGNATIRLPSDLQTNKGEGWTEVGKDVYSILIECADGYVAECKSSEVQVDILSAPPLGSMVTYAGIGRGPKAIAFDGSSMWTANSGDNTVTKITLAGASITYPGTGANPVAIAFDGINMWTANFLGNSVTKISPTGTMTTYANSGMAPTGIAFDGTNMWTSNSGDNTVTKISPSGFMTVYAGTGANPVAIAFDGVNMWTANYLGNSVTKITPTGAVTTYAGTGANPVAIAFDGINMWTANYGGNSVTKISPAGIMTTYANSAGESKLAYLLDVLTANAATGPGPYDIAFDGTNMWTANSGDNSVTKISKNGTAETYSGTGSVPSSIAFDGTNMWTANTGDSSVTKILVTTPSTGSSGSASTGLFDSSLVLTAIPDADSIFTGWFGSCLESGNCSVSWSSACSSDIPCHITITSDQDVKANFYKKQVEVPKVLVNECTATNWVCDDWNSISCVGGLKTRTCRLVDCEGGAELQSPATTQACSSDSGFEPGDIREVKPN